MQPHSDDHEEVGWNQVVRSLSDARSYWVCTVRPDGRPHATPVWGVWWRGAVVFSSPVATVKARNLDVRADAVVHLDGADDVVIVDGTADQITAGDELAELGAAFTAKYGAITGVTYDLAEARAAGMAVLAVRARVVRGWRSGEAFLARRWVLDEAGRPRATAQLSAADVVAGGTP